MQALILVMGKLYRPQKKECTHSTILQVEPTQSRYVFTFNNIELVNFSIVIELSGENLVWNHRHDLKIKQVCSTRGPHSHILEGWGGGDPKEVHVLYPKKSQLQNLSTQKHPTSLAYPKYSNPHWFCISKFYCLSSGKLKHAKYNFAFSQKQNYTEKIKSIS